MAHHTRLECLGSLDLQIPLPQLHPPSMALAQIPRNACQTLCMGFHLMSQVQVNVVKNLHEADHASL